MNEPLRMLVVSKHPRDFPNSYVARLWLVRRDAIATNQIILAPTLELLRAALPAGLHCFQRNDGDDPCIVETWM